MKYLGHVVSENGAQTDPDKINALALGPEPNNGRELRSFFGFIGYYRTFIRDYSKTVKTLNDLLVGHCTHKSPDRKKKLSEPWQWGNDQQTAFNTINILFYILMPELKNMMLFFILSEMGSDRQIS